MGQKVNPISMRLQVNKNWRSKWFASKRDYAKFLTQDLEVRRMIQNKVGTRGGVVRVCLRFAGPPTRGWLVRFGRKRRKPPSVRIMSL